MYFYALERRFILLLKIKEWSLRRRIESLQEMDMMLSELDSIGRYTIWQSWGGGKKATDEKTLENWKRIAEDDELYSNAIFCYMVCTLEKYAYPTFK